MDYLSTYEMLKRGGAFSSHIEDESDEVIEVEAPVEEVEAAAEEIITYGGDADDEYLESILDSFSAYVGAEFEEESEIVENIEAVKDDLEPVEIGDESDSDDIKLETVGDSESDGDEDFKPVEVGDDDESDDEQDEEEIKKKKEQENSDEDEDEDENENEENENEENEVAELESESEGGYELRDNITMEDTIYSEINELVTRFQDMNNE